MEAVAGLKLKASSLPGAAAATYTNREDAPQTNPVEDVFLHIRGARIRVCPKSGYGGPETWAYLGPGHALDRFRSIRRSLQPRCRRRPLAMTPCRGTRLRQPETPGRPMCARDC